MSDLGSKAWDKIFKQHGHVFREPHPILRNLLERQEGLRGETFLDLGCGTGRHVLLALDYGLHAIGLDNSPEALRLATALTTEHAGSPTFVQQAMENRLPAEDSSVRIVAAVQSIHHNVKQQIQEVFDEISRITVQNGWFFLSAPTKMNQGSAFREIEKGTFAPLDGPEEGVPHHFFSRNELEEMLPRFWVRSVEIDDTDHICVCAQRK